MECREGSYEPECEWIESLSAPLSTNLVSVHDLAVGVGGSAYVVGESYVESDGACSRFLASVDPNEPDADRNWLKTFSTGSCDEAVVLAHPGGGAVVVCQEGDLFVEHYLSDGASGNGGSTTESNSLELFSVFSQELTGQLSLMCQ